MARIEAIANDKPTWFRDAMSHAVRQLTRTRGFVVLTPDLVEALNGVRLLPPTKQADNLVLWLGSQSADPSTVWTVPYAQLASIVGSSSLYDSVLYLIQNCARLGWIDAEFAGRSTGDSRLYLRLTFAGWEHYEQIQQRAQPARLGFMAMPFGDATLSAAFEGCFRPAATDAGFALQLLAEGDGAGLIDDQLRVAIRTAKFLIAEISTGDRGAYWEAGFAEGLGRPVIYTCREDVLADRTHPRHPQFDTYHLSTVVWSPDRLVEARRKLAATLRNTFPGEAALP